MSSFVSTKEECEQGIKGVCEGCGGVLTAIETVDNSRRPTFWQGCEHCLCFRGGVELRYFKVARQLVEDGSLLPYGHMSRVDYEDTSERLSYYLDSQTAGLSYVIKRIHGLLEAIDAEPRKCGGYNWPPGSTCGASKDEDKLYCDTCLDQIAYEARERKAEAYQEEYGVAPFVAYPHLTDV